MTPSHIASLVVSSVAECARECGSTPRAPHPSAPQSEWSALPDRDVGAAEDARAASAGDAAALSRLVPVLYRDATRYLRGRLHGIDPDDLADLVSEGVIKVIERLHTIRAESGAEFFSWVHRVVWRATLDAHRTRGRRDAGWRGRPRVAGARAWPATVTPLNSASWDSALVAADPTATDDTPIGTLARLAVDAQGALPPGAAEVLWAHLVAGAGWADVAACLGTTPAAAKRRFQRALVLLRATMWARAGTLPPRERQVVLAGLRAIDPAWPNGEPGLVRMVPDTHVTEPP